MRRPPTLVVLFAIRLAAFAQGAQELAPESCRATRWTLRPGTSVQCILPDVAGELWLGSPNGPVHVVAPRQPERLVLLDSSAEIPEFNVRALLRDREGNLWLGSDGFGLMRLRPQQIRSFGPPEWRTGVSALAEDGEGGVWVGLGGRILRLDLHVSGEFVPLLEGRHFEGGIGPLAQGASGGVWISTWRGQLLQLDSDDHVLMEGLPPVLADPVQLQQVLVNLIKNSCEALAGQPGPRLIEVRSRRYDGRVQMNVSDNGPGLAPDVPLKLFQPCTTTKANGMGLGLAICHSIVEAHGGRLSAGVRPGGGVVFHADLPAGAGGRS